MATIILNQIVQNASSNSEGERLFKELECVFKQGGKIELVVDNEATLSSSFLNSSIGLFLETYGLTVFKENFVFKGSENQYKRLAGYIQKFSKTHLSS